MNAVRPWMQEAHYDTDAPGVTCFGITSTIDRRAPFLAALARVATDDRDCTLRAGLRCKSRWLLRFMWRANGVSDRIRVGLQMAMQGQHGIREAA